MEVETKNNAPLSAKEKNHGNQSAKSPNYDEE